MGDSAYIDVIVFALIAVFIGLRLRAVLGRRTGEERPPAQFGPARGNVTPFRPAPPRPAGPIIEGTATPVGEAAMAATLARIAQLDPRFSPDAFLAGARGAFEMILAAFARGDEATLKPLLADEVFANFHAVIQSRRDAGEQCDNRLMRIESADIVEAELSGQTARVTARFASQQVIVVRDSQGAVVEGDAGRPAHLVDLWTFARDPRSPDPNWRLVATRSQEE